MTDETLERALMDEIVAFYGEGTKVEWKDDSPNDLRVIGPDGRPRQETLSMPSRVAALEEVVATLPRRTTLVGLDSPS